MLSANEKTVAQEIKNRKKFGIKLQVLGNRLQVYRARTVDGRRWKTETTSEMNYLKLGHLKKKYLRDYCQKSV